MPVLGFDPVDDETRDYTLRCSVCRKKIPTKVDQQKMQVGPDVCLCDHHWLNDTTYEPPEVTGNE